MNDATVHTRHECDDRMLKPEEEKEDHQGPPFERGQCRCREG
jgi:hypothetical protein